MTDPHRTPEFPPQRVLFLPGASGEGAFWRPIAERLPSSLEKILFDWPGLGNVPADPHVKGPEDLIALVLSRMDRPVDLVAQSMGGIIAMHVALMRPALVRRLVLTATSGGVDTTRFKTADWRPDYEREFPAASRWILEHRSDLSHRIPALRVPTLLIWSDADPISPPAIGEYLAGLLPRAELVIVKGAGHMFARDRAGEVAPHIARHLTQDPKDVGSAGRPPKENAGGSLPDVDPLS